MALDQIANPGNLGAIMRTADATGRHGLILLGEGTTDPYHPTAIAASMGSIFALRFATATFTEFIDWKTSISCPSLRPPVMPRRRTVISAIRHTAFC
ncbi:MAG: hypothetical protein M5U34_02175 [Chloroflexi bacterium]|nr:hypothetical protein [Chloroflexota bacterium]